MRKPGSWELETHGSLKICDRQRKDEMLDFKLLVQPSAFRHPDLSPHRAQSPHDQTWPQSKRNTDVSFRKTVSPLVAAQTQETVTVQTERQEGKVKVAQLCLTLWDTMDCPWNSLGHNTGVGNLSLLQGIFQPSDRTQVSHIASGFFTSWATREAQEYWSGWAFSFSSGFSQPRTRTRVSCITGRFFTSWAIEGKHKYRMAPLYRQLREAGTFREMRELLPGPNESWA